MGRLSALMSPVCVCVGEGLDLWLLSPGSLGTLMKALISLSQCS